MCYAIYDTLLFSAIYDMPRSTNYHCHYYYYYYYYY